MRNALRKFVAYTCPFSRAMLIALRNKMQFKTLHFYKQHEKETIDFLESIFRERDVLLQPNEAYRLCHLARKQSKLKGDFAEVGVYTGGSAKILCHEKGDKEFFGFDTFSGLPTPGTSDTTLVQTGEFKADIEEVRRYLSSFTGVHLVQGLFPESGACVRERMFSLVHLDVDLYESILSGLTFFWGRMVVGGIIVVHDTHFEGVRKAINEFLSQNRCFSWYTPEAQWVALRQG
jgi:hypothetical protein